MFGTVLCCASLPAECSTTSDSTQAKFKAWHSANQLFRKDPIWRGGDAAYSVDLGENRVLWLFGDSFVGDGPDNTRSNRRMVRNTIAIQDGYNPTQATIKFYYDTDGEEPASFFSNNKEGEWLWPGPAHKIGSVVLLTFMRLIQKEDGIFGFRAVGSETRFLLNQSQAPPVWRTKVVPLPQTPTGVKFGTGAFLLHEGFLYAYVVVEPGNHDVYLARWDENDAAEMDLMKPGWWSGTNWVSPTEDAGVIVRNLQTEFSVTRGFDGRFWMVSVDGFGGTNVVARTAPEPEGPWSSPSVIYRPPESNRDSILVYSAKAYPHDRSQDFVFTYCTNHFDFWTMAGDMNLYFPRFVRLVHSYRRGDWNM
jgi:hypothetical protein